MELLELQQKSEELLEQLEQLKDFSEKYKQNKIQTEQVILRSSEVMMNSGELISDVNQLTQNVGSFLNTESEKLEVLRAEVANKINSHGEKIQLITDETLKHLENSFLKEQEKHIARIEKNSEKAELSLLENSQAINNVIHAVSKELRDLQKEIRVEFQTKQMELKEETTKILSGIQSSFSENSSILTGLVKEIQSEITDATKTTQNSINAIYQKVNSDKEDVIQKIEFLSAKNRRMQVVLLIIFLILLSACSFIYLKKMI